MKPFGRYQIGIVVLTAGLLHAPAEARGEEHVKGRHDQAAAIVRAMRLLPAPVPHPVIVIDPELAVDSEAVRRFDAFVVREPDGRLRQVIYLNGESQVLAAAVRGSDFAIHLLAALLIHESCHLSGGSEQDALEAESTLVRRFLLHGLIPIDAGLRFLAAGSQAHKE